ncbi:MAG: PP2C family protein-serine/threonine phosphatase [Lachnospirales bacterium]
MISYFGMSKLGKREKNEDYYKIWQGGQRYVFALADGLGGHRKGEVASQVVVDTTVEIAKHSLDDESLLDKCFMEGQKNLFEEQKRNNLVHDMKTTQVVLYVNNDTAMWAHIGDSRLYHFRNGIVTRMVERTMDHSVVQNMALAGQIKEKNIRFHEDRNVLLRVMGIDWDVPKYTKSKSVHLKKNDSFLLCSDGFWEWIDEKQMMNCLKKAQSPEIWVKMMEQIIIKNVGDKNCDNYTAIAVFVR